MKAPDLEVEYSGAKMPFTLAVVIETNKEVFERWKKRPEEVNETGVKEIMNRVVDRLAAKYKQKGGK